MVKEGVGYILLLIVDDSQPPRELETISYLRLAETTPQEIGQKLGELVFNEGYPDWVTADEAVELLSSEFRFNVMIDSFRSVLEIDKAQKSALAKAILALMWTAENTTRPVKTFFEYLVFDFDPLAKIFDDEDKYLAIPPDGYVRRSATGAGILLMKEAFWDPIFKAADSD
jgi:hypothetical protein